MHKTKIIKTENIALLYYCISNYIYEFLRNF